MRLFELGALVVGWVVVGFWVVDGGVVGALVVLIVLWGELVVLRLLWRLKPAMARTLFRVPVLMCASPSRG
ncbi:hypothetical protein RA279_27600, partial [Pseudomonas syringae pv. tagetis]